jgi:glycosyltransferase involved in cell wall biosynthesis
MTGAVVAETDLVATPETDLVVTPFTPTVDRGRALRTYGVVAALARHRNVDVLFKSFGAAEPAPEYAGLAHVALRGVTTSRRAKRGLLYAWARVTGIPRADARGLTPELGRAAWRASSVPGRGRVIADGPTAAALMLQWDLDFVYLAHNFESALRPALPHFRRDYGSIRRLRRFEHRLLLSAQESWMASRRDVELARDLAPRARLRYVPNVVDVAAIRAVRDAVSAPRALFVGDFSYPPNAQALRFLVSEVMPRVWSGLPQAELLVAGHQLALAPGTDPRVTALGFVERIEDAYALAACVMVPLLEGGGSPLKFVEALAHGLPVVATGRAAAGLEVVDRVHFLRAEGPQAFADAVVGVLREGAPDIAMRGRLLSEELYSVEALASLLRP